MESEAATLDEAELDVIHSSEIKSYLTEKVKQLQAGRIKNHFSEWASYIMDKDILGSVSGLSLEFSDIKLPHYHKGMKVRFSSKEELFFADEIKNLQEKDVTRESKHERLNENMPYIHFKIETPNCYMAKVDIKDA